MDTFYYVIWKGESINYRLSMSYSVFNKDFKNVIHWNGPLYSQGAWMKGRICLTKNPI